MNRKTKAFEDWKKSQSKCVVYLHPMDAWNAGMDLMLFEVSLQNKSLALMLKNLYLQEVAPVVVRKVSDKRGKK